MAARTKPERKTVSEIQTLVSMATAFDEPLALHCISVESLWNESESIPLTRVGCSSSSSSLESPLDRSSTLAFWIVLAHPAAPKQDS